MRFFLLTSLMMASAAAYGADATLLNVSYDVTREFYRDFNTAFSRVWKAQSGENLVINQSHGGSSKQIRAVAEGLEADVVTMNQASDIDVLVERGLIAAGWDKKFPNSAAPFTSTIVFVVRKGNPKAIRDWGDLVKPKLEVIIPSPKTSGNGRYSYLAAWGYAHQLKGGTDASAADFIRKLFANVPVLDTGGRAATTTFIQRNLGDVLLTFENEALLAIKESEGLVEIVTPPVSILAESPVAVVDKVAQKHHTEKQAEAYLRHLYSPDAQELAAKHGFRPRSADVLSRYASRFPVIKLLTVAEVANGWAAAQKVHFADGGLFDQIYAK